jgi:hypothetical protein
MLGGKPKVGQQEERLDELCREKPQHERMRAGRTLCSGERNEAGTQGEQRGGSRDEKKHGTRTSALFCVEVDREPHPPTADTGWAELQPAVPPFEKAPFEAWIDGRPPVRTEGSHMSPAGFHAFEHQWAVPAAFAFHERIGRARIAQRIHELNGRIKEGLLAVRRVTLHTPRSAQLSAGIVCFEVEGVTPEDVVKRLLERRVIASTSPYKPTYARLAGSLLNTPEEVDAAVKAVAEIAG